MTELTTFFIARAGSPPREFVMEGFGIDHCDKSAPRLLGGVTLTRTQNEHISIFVIDLTHARVVMPVC